MRFITQSHMLIAAAALFLTLMALLGHSWWQNERLKERNAELVEVGNVLREQVAQSEKALAAVEARAQRRHQDNADLRQITAAIREEDVTEQCVQSPAVQRVLVGLRSRRSNVSVSEDTGQSEDVP